MALPCQLAILLGLGLLLVGSSGSVPVELRTDGLTASFFIRESNIRKRSSPSVDQRPGCIDGAPVPPNRVNTTQRLADLRAQLIQNNVAAYIVTSDNAHQSEMVSPHDHRREFISGFTGSAGTAVVTRSQAAVWTDGRYFIQAENQLDCNWILMKQGEPDVPSIANWLKEVLTGNDTVGADPTLIGTDTWIGYRDQLNPIPFIPLAKNLIDEIWTESNGRPPNNQKPAYVYPDNYTGATWQEKAESLRAELVKQEVDAMVITALDEVAWFLNIRGSDVPYEPVSLGYIYISANQLYLFAEWNKINTPPMNQHLGDGVTVREYNQFINELPGLSASANKVLIPKAYSYTGGSSFAVYNAIAEPKRVLKTSPVLMMKAKKNPVEAEAMMVAHLNDSVALCDFISLMVEEVPTGVEWDELKVSRVLQDYRNEQGSKGPSFETIAGFAANGAIIHYSPANETNAKINTTSLLLLDSGGQYFGGTTDVTRTLHFGTPTDQQRHHYTLVLKGHIDLARLVLPKTTKDVRIDVLTRAALYAEGLDFLHGTGHGIGAMLSVHESPTYVGIGGSTENKFEENYFFSDEPGYYKTGEYGIRIESILRVIPTEFQTEFPDRFYRFEPATLVPFERKLIMTEMLDDEQIAYINDYYKLIREKVGTELLKQNRQRGYNWLWTQTEPLAREYSSSFANNINKPSLLFYTVVIPFVLDKLLHF